MSFDYNWKNKEANFGPPLKEQVDGGAHITLEIILKLNNKYIGLRRQGIPGHEAPPKAKDYPNGTLFFCHNLIRYGETMESCVKRIVKEQAGVNVKSYRVTDIESSYQKKDNQWSLSPYIIANLGDKPNVGNFGNEITEVVKFTKKTVPNDFGWWTKEELREFLEKHD